MPTDDDLKARLRRQHPHYPYALHADFQQQVALVEKLGPDEKTGESVWRGPLGEIIDRNLEATEGEWPSPEEAREIRSSIEAGTAFGTGGGAAVYFEIEPIPSAPAP